MFLFVYKWHFSILIFCRACSKSNPVKIHCTATKIIQSGQRICWGGEWRLMIWVKPRPPSLNVNVTNYGRTTSCHQTITSASHTTRRSGASVETCDSDPPFVVSSGACTWPRCSTTRKISWWRLKINSPWWRSSAARPPAPRTSSGSPRWAADIEIIGWIASVSVDIHLSIN